MSGSGREALTNVRDMSGVPPGCPGVVGRPYPMSAIGQEALNNVQNWCEALPDIWAWLEALPDVRDRLGAIPDVRVWTGSPTRCPRVVGMHPSTVPLESYVPNYRVHPSVHECTRASIW